MNSMIGQMSRLILLDTANHPMWKAWDLVCDLCVKQLPQILNSEKTNSNSSSSMTSSEKNYAYNFSSFFSEQLRSFEMFLGQIRATGYQKPTLLPIVLQVLFCFFFDDVNSPKGLISVTKTVL